MQLMKARAKFDKSLMDMSSVSRRLGRKTIELNNITKAYNGHTYIGTSAQFDRFKTAHQKYNRQKRKETSYLNL